MFPQTHMCSMPKLSASKRERYLLDIFSLPSNLSNSQALKGEVPVDHTVKLSPYTKHKKPSYIVLLPDDSTKIRGLLFITKKQTATIMIT